MGSQWGCFSFKREPDQLRPSEQVGAFEAAVRRRSKVAQLTAAQVAASPIEQLLRASEACRWRFVSANVVLGEEGQEMSLVVGSPSLLTAKAAEAAMRALCRGDSAKLLRGAENEDGLSAPAPWSQLPVAARP